MTHQQIEDLKNRLRANQAARVVQQTQDEQNLFNAHILVRGRKGQWRLRRLRDGKLFGWYLNKWDARADYERNKAFYA